MIYERGKLLQGAIRQGEGHTNQIETPLMIHLDDNKDIYCIYSIIGGRSSNTRDNIGKVKIAGGCSDGCGLGRPQPWPNPSSLDRDK